MDTTILNHLRAEAEELSRKLDAVQAVIAVYDPTVTPAPKASANSASKNDAVPPSPQPRLAGGTEYSRKIREIARDTIALSSVLPVPTRVVVDAVKQRGIEIRGLNEFNAVSALLSRSNEFQSQGRAGWILAEFAARYGVDAPNENGAAEAAPDADEAPTSSYETLEEDNDL
jgi:hypothetical protein